MYGGTSRLLFFVAVLYALGFLVWYMFKIKNEGFDKEDLLKGLSAGILIVGLYTSGAWVSYNISYYLGGGERIIFTCYFFGAMFILTGSLGIYDKEIKEQQEENSKLETIIAKQAKEIKQLEHSLEVLRDENAESEEATVR